MLKNKLLSAMGGAPANYIEDVFSTYLYTGNGSTQTITNGIDLAGEGGLVWIKSRSSAVSHLLTDSGQGISKRLSSNSTAAAQLNFEFTSWNSNGFSLDAGQGFANTNAVTYVSWTFRKAPKFFDVVTYTGNGVAGRTVAHNLGSVPGCIIIKRTDSTSDWGVMLRQDGGAPDTYFTGLKLNATNANTGVFSFAGDNTSTTFSTNVDPVGGSTSFNVNGATYIAYLFAHNAGGFGLTGEDNVISCGSYTGNGSATGPSINLGFEPQWLLVKNASVSGHYWHIVDTMRGWTDGGNEATLLANTSDSENGLTGAANYSSPTSTGFKIESASGEVNTSGATYIYIAIRRGPMKTPTTGTSVFSPIVSTASTGTALTTGFPVDMQFPIALAPTYTIANAVDRLRGVSSTTTASGRYLEQSTTNAEASGTVTRNWGNTGFQFPDYFATLKTLFLNFRRAPGFMDVVCYMGTGVARTVAHNLGAVPELMIVKCRNAAGSWWTYHVAVGNGAAVRINADLAPTVSSTFWNSTTPTDTVFSLGTHLDINGSGETNVAYLFATCAGVSKVGSYTGTGTTQQINCGFTAGARFVLIKRTDSTGDWYVWDSARGIVAGNDSYLTLNTTAAEVTTTDWVDTYSAGFELSNSAGNNVNINGASYIFLSVA